MFGGMGGMGGRNSAFRYIRLGLLAALLIGTLVFHLHGTAYDALHIVYIVVIVVAIGTALVMSRRGGSGRSGPGRAGRFGNNGGAFGSGGGSFGSAPPPPASTVFPENSDPEADG
jgi:uncharacterized membrane protein YgcG